MDFKSRLYEDIKYYENELDLVQDEVSNNDSSEEYLLNRLAELRMISIQRKIIEQGKSIMNLDTKHDSPEMIAQIENVKAQIAKEEEKNLEYEEQYKTFANVYLGLDNALRCEEAKIIDEYRQEGIDVDYRKIDMSDKYMFDNYALTEDRIKNSDKKSDDGGRGRGMALEEESDIGSDM